MMSQICLHCFVSGRVQGVFFRNASQKKAKELNLTGWAHNLSDGRVELMICGDSDAVEAMRDWLWDGPRTAEVTDVEVKEVNWESHSSFEIR
jgi:acylphosphatase